MASQGCIWEQYRCMKYKVTGCTVDVNVKWGKCSQYVILWILRTQNHANRIQNVGRQIWHIIRIFRSLTFWWRYAAYLFDRCLNNRVEPLLQVSFCLLSCHLVCLGARQRSHFNNTCTSKEDVLWYTVVHSLSKLCSPSIKFVSCDVPLHWSKRLKILDIKTNISS